VTRGEFRERLLARVERFGGTVLPSALDALETYFFLLARWNPKVNLTALPLNPPRDETFDRLFVEPIVAADHILPVASPKAVAPVWFDLGSGGGSPAIPLKIMRPYWALTMVEARERKAAFLREAARALGLTDTDVANVRFAELRGSAGGVDLLTVRAVKVDIELETVVTALLGSSGVLALFGAAEPTIHGLSVIETVQLNPPSVLTLLRHVPRGTQIR
jgi:16S rRNA (guanine527-N7)-methyltransferase